MENEYFLQLQSTSGTKFNTLNEDRDFKKSLDLIQSLGFSNSENLVERNKAIEANNAFNQAIQQACMSFKFVLSIKSYFGENTIVISTRDMIELIKKYDLVCGNFKDYKGIVPDSNAIEISSALKKISNLVSSNRPRVKDDVLYETFRYYQPIKITGIEYYRVIGERELTKRENDELNLFPVVLSDIRIGGDFPGKTSSEKLKSIHQYLLTRNIDMPDNNSICGLHAILSDNNYMFICAPREQMNVSAGIKISRRERTDDPFIFSLSPYGVVIYSMWGKESEDAMLEKYKNFLRRD